MRMDLSMRLDLPTPASPSTSTFKLTRLSKIFSRVMFVIGWRRHSHLVQAKHQNLNQVLVTDEAIDQGCTRQPFFASGRFRGKKFLGRAG